MSSQKPVSDGRPVFARAARLLGKWLGIELAPVGHIERIISLLGGMIAIYCLIALEKGLLGATGATLLIASMGASAVLLFAVPHGALSQLWAVLVGHGVSAVVEVASSRFIADQSIAAAVAVGGTIGAMHYLRAIHPPGGATALTAVVGGPDVHALGFGFVVTPVLVNAAIMVAFAVLLNAAFEWRRYPAALRQAKLPAHPAAAPRITHADFVTALRRMGTFMDIAEADFMKLEALTQEAASDRSMRAEDIGLGRTYSNDALGAEWSIRTIVDEGPGPDGGTVIWRSVTGKGRNETGVSSRREFAAWARHEVERSDSTWVRKSVEGDE